MEEAKLPDDPPTQNQNPDPNPPDTAPAPSSQPLPPSATAAASSPPSPTPAASAPPSRGKKRPLDSYFQIQDGHYFKMRAVLKDIRPHLMEVLRTVDFRSCKGADELRERLKLLMELYKQMTAETVPATKSKNAPEGQHLSNENGAGQKPREQLQDVKPADQPQSDQVLAKPSETKEAIDLEEQSRYIGGSAFGWNFITFPGNKPVYYGRTKESFRAAQKAS